MEFKESELFPPLKTFLEQNDYRVRAEVDACDVVAEKDGESILIELKKSINMKLLIQAVQRQKLSDSVYVAVERSALTGRDIKGKLLLLKRLEVGLIEIILRTKRVQIRFHPIPYQRYKDKKKQRALLRESAERTANHNLGGITHVKVVTAYREAAIFIACCLERFDEQTTTQIKARGTSPKTTQILYDNHYGWFSRTGRAQYELNSKGRNALKTYSDIAQYYYSIIN
ncbi:MAG: hypothetical protein K8S56_10600 [Candidatus Cloacimonetes bacterium]|nr:hypothetical protein [Candidatus Cloacimonadota bacterium]